VTPTRKGTETLTGVGWVTRMIAVMICGPAIIVIASGMICVFTSRTPWRAQARAYPYQHLNRRP
jgi:hypothetical protein